MSVSYFYAIVIFNNKGIRLCIVKYQGVETSAMQIDGGLSALSVNHSQLSAKRVVIHHRAHREKTESREQCS